MIFPAGGIFKDQYFFDFYSILLGFVSYSNFPPGLDIHSMALVISKLEEVEPFQAVFSATLQRNF